MTDVENVDDLDTAKQMLSLFARENDRLFNRVKELSKELAELQGRDGGKQLELEMLRMTQELQALRRQRFAESSERRPKDKKKNGDSKKRHGHGPREQTSLKLVEVHEELPQEDRKCPKCDGELEPMSGVTEDSEFVTVVRREFKVVREKRQKYRCHCNASIVTAPSCTLKPRTGGRYDLAFAISVVTAKYLDHNPLERQVRGMARQGLQVTSQTLWDQVEAVAAHLVPHYLALRDYILTADVIGADETWWRLMGGKSTKRWWAWGLTTHDACWYRLSPSRSGAVAKEILGGYEGTVMCDGYKAYEMVEKETPGLRLAHCWAHARRKFVEARDNYPGACDHALEQIGKLFEVDRGLPNPDSLEGQAKVDALSNRVEQRLSVSKQIVDEFRQWLMEQHGLPKSGLRKATDYALRYWKGLTAFLDDPLLDLDNNRTERALRGMVVGRKNHYGSRSERGTQAAAVLGSVRNSVYEGVGLKMAS